MIITILYTLLIFILLIVGSYIFFHYILLNYKLSSNILDFEDLLAILNIMINTNLELYEKNIFDERGAITNSNFDNYYYEISNGILSSLSKSFYKSLSYYISEDSIATIIARKVKDYLISKIK